MRILFLLCSLCFLWSCTSPAMEELHSDTGADLSSADTHPDVSSPDRCFTLYGAGTGDVPTFDLTVIGDGLEAWNGEVIRIVVDTDGWGEQRYGVAQTVIESGAFVVTMPDALELDYTSIGIYVDTTRDDTCTPGEPLWNANTGILTGDMTVEHMFEWTEGGGCNINGMFNLAVPLSCSP